MSTLFVNNLNTASGTTITVPTGKQVIGTDTATFKQPGMILQTITGNSNTVFDSTSTSWTDTGLFSLTFPQNLQSGSKVLARIMATIGETNNNNWSNRMNLSIFENTTNKGDATYGMVNGNAQHQGTTHTQYEANRITGEVLFTPSVLNGTYKLYFKGETSNITYYVGRTSHNGAQNPTGQTQIILQEIAQ